MMLTFLQDELHDPQMRVLQFTAGESHHVLIADRRTERTRDSQRPRGIALTKLLHNRVAQQLPRDAFVINIHSDSIA